jgi:hypothetical protein
MRFFPSSICSILALSATTTSLASSRSTDFEAEYLSTHPQLRINVNDLTSLVENVVPNAIESYGQEQDETADLETFLGDDMWLGQFTMNDQSLLNERSVYPWLKDNGDGTFKLKAVCVKQFYIDFTEAQGRILREAYGERRIPTDIVDLSPVGDGFVVDMNLPDFAFSATFPVDMTLACLWRNIEVETDRDGYVPADPDEWNITGTGFGVTLDGELSVGIEGLSTTATATLNTDGSDISFDGLADIVVDFDRISIDDIDLEYDGLLFDSSLSGSTDFDAIQDLLDDMQSSLEDTVDKFNRIPLVDDRAAPTINRFDGLTIENYLESELSDALNSSAELQEQIATPIDESLDEVLRFPLDMDADDAKLTGDVALADLDIARSEASSAPEIQTTWDIDAELRLSAHSCASELETPIDFNASSTPQSSSDLDAVLDYGFMEEAIYVLAKQGDFCHSETSTDPSTGAEFDMSFAPSGRIEVRQAEGSPEELEIVLPIAILGTGSLSSSVDTEIEASANLVLTASFEIDCDQRLLLDITNVETTDFAGSMALSIGTYSTTIDAPDLSSEINATLLPYTVSETTLEASTEFYLDDCIIKERTVLNLVVEPCELCDIQLTEGMLPAPGLNSAIFIEDVVLDSDAVAIGLGFAGTDTCAEGGSDTSGYEDCLPSELRWADDLVSEFDSDRYIGHEMAALSAELEARFGIEYGRDFVEDLLGSQSNGPIFETGEEWISSTMWDLQEIVRTDTRIMNWW